MILSLERVADLLIAQRDKHLSRIEAVNRQLSIGSLALAATLLFGGLASTGSLGAIAYQETSGWLLVALAVFVLGFVAGLVLVFRTIYQHAYFHSRAARLLDAAIDDVIRGADWPVRLTTLSGAIHELVGASTTEPAEWLLAELNGPLFPTACSPWVRERTLWQGAFWGCSSVALCAFALAVIFAFLPPSRQRMTENNGDPSTSPTGVVLVHERAQRTHARP